MGNRREKYESAHKLTHTQLVEKISAWMPEEPDGGYASQCYRYLKAMLDVCEDMDKKRQDAHNGRKAAQKRERRIRETLEAVNKDMDYLIRGSFIAGANYRNAYPDEIPAELYRLYREDSKKGLVMTCDKELVKQSELRGQEAPPVAKPDLRIVK